MRDKIPILISLGEDLGSNYPASHSYWQTSRRDIQINFWFHLSSERISRFYGAAKIADWQESAPHYNYAEQHLHDAADWEQNARGLGGDWD